VSVNLSRHQLAQPGLVEHIDETLRAAGLAPECVKLEITESAVMENPELALESLRGLRALGVALAVDDFGTGYSSLSHLDSFPFQTVKIDQSFVRGREFAHKDVAILQTIIQLCRELSMDVVAEGIETPEQLSRLRDLGCGLGQGYLFSRPLPGDEMERLLEADPVW
jgi:EAL domain-containing protein (putative c-di-GMP-specific phosphodiesterase class I)